MMNIDEKKKLALEVIARLKQAYPDAACSLDYNEAWKLLVSVRLAAQCTDARVNMIVPKLYEKFPDVNALADAPVEEIEEIVRPCGLGKSKARDISACMRMLRDVYDGNVPDDFDALLKLPGVGRKSANLIMGDVFGKPAIVTDTHCIRLCNRIGLVDHIMHGCGGQTSACVYAKQIVGGKTRHTITPIFSKNHFFKKQQHYSIFYCFGQFAAEVNILG